jgi:hypothetical protein
MYDGWDEDLRFMPRESSFPARYVWYGHCTSSSWLLGGKLGTFSCLMLFPEVQTIKEMQGNGTVILEYYFYLFLAGYVKRAMAPSAIEIALRGSFCMILFTSSLNFWNCGHDD